MKIVALRLGAAMAGMLASVLLLRWTHSDAFFFTFIASFLLTILFWMDFGRELRSRNSPSPLMRAAGILFGVPQAVLGLVSMALGLSMIAWVLYNSFVQKLPQYTGGFLTLGIGPLLVAAGGAWVVGAFRRESNAKNVV